jgi:phenylacetate-coenzyme A ligase PaaK-like adenylate-forming protein
VCAAERSLGESPNRRFRTIHRSLPVLVGVVSKSFWDSCDRERTRKTLLAERTAEGSSAERIQTLYVEAGAGLADELLAALYGKPANDGQDFSVVSYIDLADLSRLMLERPDAATGCIYGLSIDERADFLERLGGSAVTRTIPLDAFPERPDGRLSEGMILSELVRIVTDEPGGIRELLRDAAECVPYYRERAPAGDVTQLDAWPLLTGADLALEPLHKSRRLLHRDVVAGSIFSSGGTSTAPKYALYTQPEMSRSTDMLAHGFRANGLRPGDKAVNLFIAGHLWSAFLAVDEALRRCGAYVFPMGGLAPMDDIVACLSTFRPQLVFGLPSLLVGYARHCESAGIDVTIERIFYAGEHFNPSAREYVRRVWKTQSFHSAGYAAVDVGPIGWQCAFSQGGEHHLFANDVHLEIVDEEAVVTSLVRRAMPVIRYRTGDRVEWVPSDCPCGSRDPRFRLLGRVDGLINIWGCRVAYEDVERALREAGLHAPVLQLVIQEASEPAAQMERLMVRLEQTEPGPGVFEAFVGKLHQFSRDLSVALDIPALSARVELDFVPPDTIPRIARTGKVRLILDQRGSGRS